MEIKETNLQSAYNTADENGKQMLRALFPDVRFLNNGNKQKLPITERIKTFNDACYELGDKHPYVQDYLTIDVVKKYSIGFGARTFRLGV